ncbi:MAG: DedA family protein [Candidatus Kerfeldbacteria bacterium]|nr:DedA family protein [Candidatus Kerfeldbacteria bacterium]
MGITEFLVDYITAFISVTGYVGIALLMTLESMIAPVPSEAVMPFAGFLVSTGRFNLLGIILASSIGSLIGSIISYYLGKYGGKAFIKKFGKYLLLNEHHLATTERFFAQYGDRAIFVSRFVPVVRHLISVPAGVGGMNLGKFIVYTLVGATLWNSFLGYVGVLLGDHWTVVKHYSEWLDIIVVLGIVGTIGYFIYRQLPKHKP